MKASRLAIPITKKIKEICETKGCLLNLHFTTNGTLLIPSIADSILDIGVPTSFQIAFDGDRYYHNMAKNISGLGTYDTLLNNIKYVLSLKMKVNIRCNYTATNISSFKNLVKDLAAIGILNNPFLRLSFQRVWQEKMTSELLNNVSDVVRFVSTMGGVGRMEGSGIARSFCYADYCNSYVFNYNGDVFKCTARDFSHSNRIGYLNSDGTIDFSEKILPFSHRFKAQCDGCSLLPICTICAQARIESTSQGCPRTISESDKEHQIRSRFNEIYSNFLIA